MIISLDRRTGLDKTIGLDDETAGLDDETAGLDDESRARRQQDYTYHVMAYRA